MIEIQLPPDLAALCQSCESICEKECCGIGAFNFSPFNIIYHLTKWKGRIFNVDVEGLRSELTNLAAEIQNFDQRSAMFVLAELNAILTKEQLLALIDEIEFALTKGCTLFDEQKDRLEKRYQAFQQIVSAPE